MTKIQAWFATLFFTLALTSAWSDPATNAAPLKVGVTPDFPPTIYKEAGKITGVEADFAATVGAALGRPVEFVELKWEDQIPALLDGRTDIIMSGMSITRARELRVNFTKPWLITGQIALVRRENMYQYALGYPARRQDVIGVLKATTGDFVVQQEFSVNQRKEFKSGEDAARALMRKRIDLFICDAPTVWWLAGVHEADGLVAVPIYLTQEQLAWGVRRSDTDLLDSVNAALANLQKSGRANEIVRHWIPLIK